MTILHLTLTLLKEHPVNTRDALLTFAEPIDDIPDQNRPVRVQQGDLQFWGEQFMLNTEARQIAIAFQKPVDLLKRGEPIILELLPPKRSEKSFLPGGMSVEEAITCYNLTVVRLSYEGKPFWFAGSYIGSYGSNDQEAMLQGRLEPYGIGGSPAVAIADVLLKLKVQLPQLEVGDFARA